MASSHSSTVLKLEKSGMLRSRRGRWTLKGTQAGPVKNNDNTKWQLEHQSQSRPPGYDSKMNYYITFSKFETELTKIPPALSMNQYFPNEVIGFREPIYSLSLCGKFGPWSCSSPQTKLQTGIMEISKPWLSKETNTQSRNASNVLKILKVLQSRICLKHSWEGSDLSNQGFNLHNRSAPWETRDKSWRCCGWHCSKRTNLERQSLFMKKDSDAYILSLTKSVFHSPWR